MHHEQPNFFHEQKFLGQGIVVGVDEAGRGPWAGPVMAGAVWIDPELVERLPFALKDSKKLSASKRQQVLTELTKLGLLMAVGHADVEEIDRVNILNATYLAMERACIKLQDKLKSPIKTILVDGNRFPFFKDMTKPKNMVPIVKGDNISLSIAAASIIAKQTRDLFMCELHNLYPEYQFNKHKGYGTKIHQAALDSLGPTAHHRKSFAPIKKLIQ